LRKIWTENNRKSEKNQRNELVNALKDLRTEYFFINFLPEEEDFGYIALLRDVRPIARAQFFTNRIDAKFTRREPPYPFRLGRLNDYLKYALTQQFATLFARIGLPAEYEGDRNEIIESLCAQCVLIDEKA
jgi:hypothetical protein